MTGSEVQVFPGAVFTEQNRLDFEWAGKHWSELVKDHVGKWIAVWQQRVVAVGHDYAEVVQRAQAEYGAGCDPVVGFVDDASYVY